MIMNNKNQSHKYYFDRPEIWEEVNQGRFEREPKFLLDIFKKYGEVKEILDVGCGTGSHLAKLEEFGLTGIGIDLNEKMIEFAKQKYPSLKFDVKDMRELDYSNQFDAVLCLCTTFSYNTTNDEVVASLRGFSKALRKGGIIVIDLLNTMGFIQKIKFENKIEASYEKFGLRSETEHRIDENRQILIEKRSIFSARDNKQVKSDTTDFRLFFPQEFKLFLETSGFEFLEFYGSYDIGHTILDKSRMIVVAKK